MLTFCLTFCCYLQSQREIPTRKSYISPELTGDADARLPVALIKSAEASVLPVFQNAAVVAPPEEIVAISEPTAVVS